MSDRYYFHNKDCPLAGMEDNVPCAICDLIARVRDAVAEDIAQAIEAEHGGVLCYAPPTRDHGYRVCTHTKDAAIARRHATPKEGAIMRADQDNRTL